MSGKPTIVPLAANFVAPIPPTSSAGNSMFFSFPLTIPLISSIALGFVLNGLVLFNVGTNNRMSLNPSLLFFKLAARPSSPGFFFFFFFEG